MQPIKPINSNGKPFEQLFSNVLVERNQQRLKRLHKTCQELRKNKNYFKSKGYIVSLKRSVKLFETD